MATQVISFPYGHFPKVGTVFTLPDQVDGEDYNTWSSPGNSPQCCVRSNVPQYTSVVAVSGNNTPTSNQFNHTNNVVIQNSFTVPAGVICTLSAGMTLRFHPGASVIIEPTGRLYWQSGAALTGLECDTVWEGVRVLGNPNQPQTLAWQGYLNIQSNATVSHARIGVTTHNVAAGNFNQSGGLVQTSQANFIDNLQDVYIPLYSYTSNNFFELSNFRITNAYPFGTQMNNRVTITQVAPVHFRGCTFANDNLALQTSALNVGSGIFSVDANFTLDKKTVGSVTTRSAVQKFNIGVYAIFLYTNRPYIVQYTDFTDNQMGVLSGAVNNCTIFSNTFTETNWNFVTNTGVFVDRGIGWSIRDNVFTGAGQYAWTFPRTWGTVVKNTNVTNPSNLAVYRNNYSLLFCANQSEGINRGLSNTDPGLLYSCNTQSNNLFDIRVLLDPNILSSYPNSPQGIRHNHWVGGQSANPKISVQNSFSNNPSLFNGQQWCNLWVDNVSQVGNIQYSDPSQLSGLYNTVKVSAPTGSWSTNTCTATNPVFLTFGNLLASGGLDAAQYEQAKQEHLNALYLHNLLIDNGNTQQVKQSIDYNWSNDAWQLRNQLLNLSPNVSSEALLHAANKGTLPSALLFEVALANLRSVKSPMVLEKLKNEVPNALPDYMIDLLIEAQEPASTRQIIEDQIVASGSTLSSAYNSILGFLKADTTTDRYSQMVELLNDVPLLDAKLQLVDEHIARNNSTEAANALNTYATMAEGKVSAAVVAQVQEFTNFRIAKASSGIFSLSPADVTYLQSIAADSAHAFFVQAHNILRVNGLSTYQVKPFDPLASQHKMLKQTTPSVSATPLANLKLYPNPASNYITLELDYKESPSVLQAQIIDYTGKVLVLTNLETIRNNKSITNLSVQQLPNGVYTITVKDGSATIATKTFTKN